MDEVVNIYSEGKLLVRAMDFPQLQRGKDGFEYNSETNKEWLSVEDLKEALKKVTH